MSDTSKNAASVEYLAAQQHAQELDRLRADNAKLRTDRINLTAEVFKLGSDKDRAHRHIVSTQKIISRMERQVAEFHARLQAPLPDEVAQAIRALKARALDETVWTIERLARSTQEARREVLEGILDALYKTAHACLGTLNNHWCHGLWQAQAIVRGLQSAVREVPMSVAVGADLLPGLRRARDIVAQCFHRRYYPDEGLRVALNKILVEMSTVGRATASEVPMADPSPAPADPFEEITEQFFADRKSAASKKEEQMPYPDSPQEAWDRFNRAGALIAGHAPAPADPLCIAAAQAAAVLRFCIKNVGGECLGDHPEMLTQARVAILAVSKALVAPQEGQSQVVPDSQESPVGGPAVAAGLTRKHIESWRGHFRHNYDQDEGEEAEKLCDLALRGLERPSTEEVAEAADCLDDRFGDVDAKVLARAVLRWAGEKP